MSVSVSVYLKDGTLPTPAAWQAAITQHGFELTLDLDFDPATLSGFLPAQYRGQPAGFEFFLEEIDEDAPDEVVAGPYHQRLSLVTHSNMAETISATIAAGVLAHLSGGLLWDDESGEGHAPETALAWARRSEAEALPHL